VAWLVEDGVPVECKTWTPEGLLAAARRVEFEWGLEADQFRHHHALFDPDGFFARLREAAASIPAEAFERALADSWFWAWQEKRSKLLAAVDAGGRPLALFLAWSFAYSAALRIALRERRPYESLRTLWADAAARGYGMDELVAALSSADLDRISRAVEHVWNEIGGWGAPRLVPQGL
jgi:kanamycin nucleotidyltransferase